MLRETTIRFLQKTLTVPQAPRAAYFVLDGLGDKVAGPFGDQDEARTHLSMLEGGEFYIATEYWEEARSASDVSSGFVVGGLRQSFLRVISRSLRPDPDQS